LILRQAFLTKTTTKNSGKKSAGFKNKGLYGEMLVIWKDNDHVAAVK